MLARPHVKKYRKNKTLRCPKCQKVIRAHQKRCRTCHLAQPKR